MKPVRTALIFWLVALLGLSVSVSGSPASYQLFGSSTSGWGFSDSEMTVPGRDLSASPSETVSLTLTASDGFVHDFGVDYNDNGVPDGTEPISSRFGGGDPNPNTIAYSFTASSSEGVYKYYCYFHKSTMFGRFIIGAPQIQRDVAITQVSASTSRVGQGGTPLITVTVVNEGDEPESFNVAAYYDNTVIGSQSVSALWLDRSSTLHFFWNTVNVQPGTYAIKANASIVAGELDILDNERVDGTITVDPLPDTEAPTWLQDRSLTVSSITTSSLSLSWSGVTDNVGISGYRVYRDGSPTELTGDVRSHVVLGLALGTEYVFKVEAGDASGNWSTDGPSLIVRTQSQPSGNITSDLPTWLEYWYVMVLGGGVVAVLAFLAVRGRKKNARDLSG